MKKLNLKPKLATTTAISIVAILSLMVVSQSAIFPHNALATKEKSTVNDNTKDCSQQSNEQIDNNNKNNKDCNQNANNQEQEDKDNGKDKSNDA